MSKPGGKSGFYLLSVGIVAAWIFMLGLLIQKTHVEESQRAAAVPADTPKPAGTRYEWMEIFLKGKKVGFTLTRVTPRGKDRLIQEKMVLTLNLMGQPNVMNMDTEALVDENFFMKRFALKLQSGVVRFNVSGAVSGDLLRVKMGQKGQVEDYEIPLSEPVVIGSGISEFFKNRPLKKGDAFQFAMFDPSTLSQKNMVMRVVEQEKIALHDEAVSTFRLESRVWGQDLVFWVNQKGELVKEEGFMGLTLIRSDAFNARRDLDGTGGADFYKMAAVSVKKSLPNARHITCLKLNATGLAGTPFDVAVLNEGRQRFQNGLLEIRREVFEKPEPGSGVPEDVKRFLLSDFRIQSDHPKIVQKAREIAGSQKTPFLKARTLLKWVYDTLQKRPVMSIPRALEVLKTGVGDCNEHAVLLTALLRAAGIPARECVGLVYTDSKFYYHAWTEAYLGQWITMDATLDQMPADATHIKLAHGGLDRQTELMSLIGKLRLEILDYEYDSAESSHQTIQKSEGR